CNARARGTARDADSSDLRESGVKSGPRGAWPSSRRRRGPIPMGVPNSARSCHVRRMAARSRHSGGCGRPGRGVHRAGAGAGGVFDPQSLCETRSDADRLTIRRRRGHSPPERIWTYPLAPVSAGSRPYCPATKPHVVPGTHRPPLQTSPPVQLFPSEQGAALLVWTQPVAELQVSSVHTFPSSQLSAGPPTQPPLLQVSLVVQPFPSVHGAVLVLWTQPVLGLQVSSVQTLPSSQLGARPPTHTPPPHRSLRVQAFPSSHEAVLFVWTHPVVGVQLSSVQGLPSWQFRGVPG